MERRKKGPRSFRDVDAASAAWEGDNARPSPKVESSAMPTARARAEIAARKKTPASCRAGYINSQTAGGMHRRRMPKMGW